MIQSSRTTTAERMKELRLGQGSTIYDVADAIGVTAGTISRYESGEINPKEYTIEKYAQYFKVNPHWITGASDEKCGAIKHSEILVPIVKYTEITKDIRLGTLADNYTHVPYNSGISFATIAASDCMINARILPGDMIYVRKQPKVQNGEIALLELDGETTMRRIVNAGVLNILHPENPAYKGTVLHIKEMKAVPIIGRVIAVRFEVV